MPKSFLGPVVFRLARGPGCKESGSPAARIVARCEEYASRCLALPNDMTGGRRGQNAILADQKLLDAIRRTDFGNQLDHLGIPVPAIAANYQEGACERCSERSVCIPAG